MEGTSKSQRGPATQERPESRQELRKVIRLWQVVVGAGVETRRPARLAHRAPFLFFGTLTCADRSCRHTCKPLMPGQRACEHHQVVIVDAGLLECGGASCAPPTVNEYSRNPRASTATASAFVFHDEDPDAGRSVATPHDIRFRDPRFALFDRSQLHCGYCLQGIHR